MSKKKEKRSQISPQIFRRYIEKMAKWDHLAQHRRDGSP